VSKAEKVLKVGGRCRWNFHGFEGEGKLDHIDHGRYYIRPAEPITSPGTVGLVVGFCAAPGSAPTEHAPWPFVVVAADQVEAL
jgi:hypothetical protein